MAFTSIAHRILTCAAVLAAGGLAGCATLNAAPKPYLTSKKLISDNQKYLGAEVLTCYYQAQSDCRGGMTPVQWRDTVIAVHIAIADARYIEFRRSLNAESGATNLGLDVAAIGTTGWASVAAQNISNRLAAISTGLLGIKGAFSKDLFYEKTLPAVVAAMDANRAKVLLNIRQSQANPTYRLDAALADVGLYESAGTMDGAISQLTTVAATEAAKTQQEAQTAAQLIQIKLRTPDAQAKAVTLANAVRAHRNDKAFLDAVANKLKIARNSDLNQQVAAILARIDLADDDAKVAQLQADLAPIINAGGG